MRDHIELPDRIKDLLSGAARRFGIEDGIAVSKIWAHWNQVVGPEIAGHARPASLRGGVLRVQAESPVWATEIGYLGDEIRSRVNVAVGAPVVRSVSVFTARSGSFEQDRQRRGSGVPNGPAERGGSAPRDPFEAFERARRAWASKRR